jgi:hypothetical protein
VAKKSKRLFESDRKMELRLRLALKHVAETGGSGSILVLDGQQPPRELVNRLIARVRKL